MSTTKSK